jgi:TRAP-type C4-dicarboxylate transport system permease small subunit
MGILVPSSDDIATFLMVGMALFGFVYAYREGAHVRVDTLFRLLPKLLQHGVELFNHFAAALLCLALAFFSAKLTHQVYKFNDLSDGLLPIPLWIPMATIPVGFLLFAALLAADCVRILRRQRVMFAVSDRDEALSLITETREPEQRT